MPSFNKQTGRWRARVKHQGLDIYLGSYPTYELAESQEINFRHTHKRGMSWRFNLKRKAVELIGEDAVKLLAKNGIGFRSRDT